jgi:hypothetical protein
LLLGGHSGALGVTLLLLTSERALGVTLLLLTSGTSELSWGKIIANILVDV